MLVPLWRLVPGPEWDASLLEANPGDDYFERNVSAAREALAHSPYEVSREFSEHDVRIFTTRDVAAGYRLVVLVRMHPAEQTCELGWVMLEWLEDE